MAHIKGYSLCKILAVVLSILIAGQAHFVLAGRNQEETQAAKDQAAVLEEQFENAKNLYFAEKYEEAKVELEKIMNAFASLEGYELLKGRTYLLLGASYEKLKYKELAIKYYCRAKEILGVGKTIEGLELKKLKYYKADCAAMTGRATGRRSGSFIGKALGTLLFIGALGGLVWYLFFSPNAPFKKKSETYTFRSVCFSTFWKFTIHSEWMGPYGEITLSPANTAPQPNENNNWDDSVTYTLSASGGTLVSVSLVLDVEVGGGDNGRRHDQAWVDGSLVLDETNTFSQSCSSPGKVYYADIYGRSSLGSFTLRHKVELSRSSGDKLDSANIATDVKIIKE